MCADEMFIYSADVSYLPLSEMGHGNAALKPRNVFSIKIPI